MANYKPKEFANMIGVSIRTLQRWDTDGKLVAKRSPSNRRYYTHDQYKAYLSHTGMAPNMTLNDFNTHLTNRLASDTQPLAVIQVDINGLKTLNATYGIDACDDIIAKMKTLLINFVGSPLDVINPVADVFIMIKNYTSVTNLISIIEKFDRQLTSLANDIQYCTSWGIYPVKNRNETALSLIDKATIARRSVKKQALDNIGIYSAKLQDDMDHVRLIENKMSYALKNNEFVLYLQPKYDLANKHISGAEALIRWIEPDGTVIEPSDFIPVFEQNGFVIQTDRFIWEEVCKTLNDWKARNINLVPISINVSRRNLINTDFTTYLNELAEIYSVDKSFIEVEITESFDTPIDKALVKKLKNDGFTLLMDDFGSGYSSLNTLHQTDFDVIKLDREFLSHFMESSRGRMIVQHTISMIKDINLHVMAEGVETQEQADFLENNGCYIAQGFLYSKPIPVKEFEKLLLEIKL